MKNKIILASSSPRRKQLMEMIGLEFEIIVSNADENAAGTGCEQAAALAARKALAVANISDKAVIIGADTLVEINGQVLGKPANAQEAFDMLKTLQGQAHMVHTGVAIIDTSVSGNMHSFVESAKVFFRKLDDAEIHSYIATGEPFDKAGAYGIQGRGAVLVEKIDGDFYAVMGLPIAKLAVALKEMGINIWAQV